MADPTPPGQNQALYCIALHYTAFYYVLYYNYVYNYNYNEAMLYYTVLCYTITILNYNRLATKARPPKRSPTGPCLASAEHWVEGGIGVGGGC